MAIDAYDEHVGPTDFIALNQAMEAGLQGCCSLTMNN